MKAVWFLEDQLTCNHPGLHSADPATDCLIFIESAARYRYLPYHQHRIILLSAAMRHYAEERRSEGWTVHYYRMEDTPDYRHAWQHFLALQQPKEILLLDPNNFFEEKAIRQLAALLALPLRWLPTNLFLETRENFARWAAGKKRLLMEMHYRRMREKFGLLLSPDGNPLGGKWNFDSENRCGLKEWKQQNEARPIPPPACVPSAITLEVMDTVNRLFPSHSGRADSFWLPVTRSDSLRWLEHFVRHHLPHFGTFQDLMIEENPHLFHSLISPMLNLGLLRPLECVEKAVEAHAAGLAPLAATEAFVRQIIGWREFVNGVYWLRMPEYLESNALEAKRSLPAFFWDGKTDMACLRSCLRQALDTGYNHHIQRLMVLGNFLLLAGVEPREAFAWFSAIFVDAHDWVMAANVLGMVLHADGGFMATKPYAGGGAYISRMSNYCQGCHFDPKKKNGVGACPFNLLYWAFYDRHAERFSTNPRISMIVRSWMKRPVEERTQIVAEAEAFLESFAK